MCLTRVECVQHAPGPCQRACSPGGGNPGSGGERLALFLSLSLSLSLPPSLVLSLYLSRPLRVHGHRNHRETARHHRDYKLMPGRDCLIPGRTTAKGCIFKDEISETARLQRPAPASQDQNLALTVLYVPRAPRGKQDSPNCFPRIFTQRTVTGACAPGGGNPETRSPKPETRSPKPETRSLKPKARSPKPETRNPKFETRSPKPETRSPKPETRNPKFETRSPNPKPEARSPKPETLNPNAQVFTWRWGSPQSRGTPPALGARPRTPGQGFEVWGVGCVLI